MVVRWYRFRKYQIVILFILILCILYYISLQDNLDREENLDITRRIEPLRSLKLSRAPTFEYPNAHHLGPNDLYNRYIEEKLEEALKEDKGTGCEIPKLDPFAKEVTKFDKILPKVVCQGKDWVKCYHSECRVTKEILDTTTDIECIYNDIIYINDGEYVIGEDITVKGNNSYVLTRSDHVKVKCIGNHIDSILPSKWKGHSLGFRSSVHPKTPPQGRENTLNVLILGFDSTSHNGFVRRMPKSYQFLKDEFKATILQGYNIVGDGTPAALFPILTGKTELELPDVRKKMNNNGSLDSMPFIFYKLHEDGYRTAYFEDMPWIGTFQYRFKGFKHRPADHYLRDFYLEESNGGKKWWNVGSSNRYCVGDTPQYKLMLNITDQFLKLDGKKFCFTFIADITHDNFNMISTADEDLVDFLRGFRQAGHLEHTLLMVMGDHGPRYAYIRDTLQGKLEERLPLMGIVLPEVLKRERPFVEDVLRTNAQVLTTPHDIYATVLDVLHMRQHWNTYRVTGADLTRGLTLLEPIPKNRSCSEAGIEPHWCACLAWRNVTEDDPLYQRTAEALVNYINSLTEEVREKCVLRTLTSISWVMRQRGNSRMLSFVAAKDGDGYVGKFGAKVRVPRENYQVKIIVGPSKGVYEASMLYIAAEDKFEINSRDISRTNAYNNEPSCISATHPHLNMYCYCND
ncbi:PREDICTED: uncharacterized protein LOC106125813 isoform X2 [Papilio xuthus]|uniref:Uncharacterized protein LOC106125813 isoform X2 n=1 Tax=Papilio xuthus TaxID=66420 RepID=A0AAJ7EII5_PAPXU|nr:PREDICTED: uncharacterized protein LOC106125813 isoform X2 [Papilio xuthus]